MSTPWLSKDFKPSSKSRSRSRSRSLEEEKRTRIDEFGRTVPVKSRSRSRSRSRERRRRSFERSRGRFSRESNRSRNDRRSTSREQGRRNDKFVRQRRRRSGSSCSGDDDKLRPVASHNPKYENARLFVANLNCSQVTKGDLLDHFKKYGEVIDVLVHPKNYAFIQYGKEEDAKLAVEGESGSTFQGRRLDVKMAIYGKRGNAPTRGGLGRGKKGAGPDREWSASRDETYDDFRPRGHRPQPPRYPGERGGRDPFYPPPAPYPGFQDPWFPEHDDPYRLDPYRDPYVPRGPVPAPPPPSAKIECQIFVVSPKLKTYGEAIEDRIKEHCIITAVTVMPEGGTASLLLEEFAERDGLFAIFVNAQNEVHRSLTLNILHGTPQEHRNMPMNDAVALVGRSFEEYVDMLREKAKAATATASSSESSSKAATTATSSQGFLAASSDVAYLLNLLADNQALTVSELEDVIEYLKKRRGKMMDAERKNQARNDPKPTESSEQAGNSGMSSAEEITQKILSIFSSAGGNLQGIIPAAMQGQGQQAQPQPKAPPPSQAQSQHQHQSSSTAPKAGGNTIINFDNPNVQKALDQLIQSSPVLRQNFSVSSDAAPVPSIESVSQIVGRSSMTGYGHGQGPAQGPRKGGMQQESPGVPRGQGLSPPAGSSRPYHHQQQHY